MIKSWLTYFVVANYSMINYINVTGKTTWTNLPKIHIRELIYIYLCSSDSMHRVPCKLTNIVIMKTKLTS